MKKRCAGLLGLALTSALALPANAADWYGGPAGYKDVPYVPVTWAGFYAGVSAGYGWGANSDQLAYADTTVSPPVTFGGLSPSGGFGGIQLGYNWQGLFGLHPNLVLGIEADIQVAAIDGRATDIGGDSFKSRLEDFGTVRGRIGYSFGQTLAYFTGGFAYGSVNNQASINNANSGLYGADFATNPSATGYVLGGGLEYKINPSLSVKGEYQYINLGQNGPADTLLPAGPYALAGGTVRDDAFHTFRAGINWFPFTAYAPLK
ncbi:MAG: outer membrane protein [Rhodomicrobium sp.]